MMEGQVHVGRSLYPSSLQSACVLEPDTKLQTAEESLMYGLFMGGYSASEQEAPSKVRTVSCVIVMVNTDHKLHV